MPSRLTFTVDEIIATLNHSSLPSVVAEGDDDAIVLRRLEDVYGKLGLSLLFVGGRNGVLGTFDRRDEILTGKKVAFIADKDLWVFTEIPPRYVERTMIFTTGYSIENDIYQDGDLEELMNGNERARFSKELTTVVACFSLAAARCIAGRDGQLSFHPNSILDDRERQINALKLVAGEAFPADLNERVAANYKDLLRGKTLIALLMRQLSYRGRPVRHNHRAIFEMVANAPGQRLKRLFGSIGAIFT